jgi:tRNA(Ile)-lysidine synthase
VPTHSTALTSALAPLRGKVMGLDDVTGPVVVGCSGGADSLTLLAVACERGLEPIAVHVDHGLRPSSTEEGERVAAAATMLGARAESRRVDVGAGPNLEARAREARYEALTDATDAHGASVLLVGHTADDQAETVLLALLRGSGSAGLAGMPVRRGRLVRPLLAFRRAETEACCAALGLDPVRDPMNDDRAHRRAWIRHEVLPLLESGAARDLVPVLVRQADVLREESGYLDALARAAWPPGSHHAPSAALARLPRALARRAVRCWLGAPPPSLEEVERVLTVARGETRATELAGGRRVRRSRGEMIVDREPGVGWPRRPTPEEASLATPTNGDG